MSYVINMPSTFVDVTPEEMTYDGGSFWSFIGGVLGILGGVCAIISGVALLLTPDPSMGSKVGGIAGIISGAATIGAGACVIADAV